MYIIKRIIIALIGFGLGLSLGTGLFAEGEYIEYEENPYSKNVSLSNTNALYEGVTVEVPSDLVSTNGHWNFIPKRKWVAGYGCNIPILKDGKIVGTRPGYVEGHWTTNYVQVWVPKECKAVRAKLKRDGYLGIEPKKENENASVSSNSTSLLPKPAGINNTSKCSEYTRNISSAKKTASR